MMEQDIWEEESDRAFFLDFFLVLGSIFPGSHVPTHSLKLNTNWIKVYAYTYFPSRWVRWPWIVEAWGFSQWLSPILLSSFGKHQLPEHFWNAIFSVNWARDNCETREACSAHPSHKDKSKGMLEDSVGSRYSALSTRKAPRNFPFFGKLET